MVQGVFYQILKNSIDATRHDIREYLADMSPFPNFNEAQFLVKMYAKKSNIRFIHCFDYRSKVDLRTV